jgi:hypothetical protein
MKGVGPNTRSENELTGWVLWALMQDIMGLLEAISFRRWILRLSVYCAIYRHKKDLPERCR